MRVDHTPRKLSECNAGNRLLVTRSILRKDTLFIMHISNIRVVIMGTSDDHE